MMLIGIFKMVPLAAVRVVGRRRFDSVLVVLKVIQFPIHIGDY